MSSREVAGTVGLEGETLEERAERLRAVVATPNEREIAARELLEVEARLAERDRAALKQEAQKRVLGIRRAYTGLADQLDQDERKVVEAARAYAAAVARMAERFLQLGELKAECDGLIEGFALDAKPLPAVAILATRREWHEACEIVARAGVPDTNRTTLQEIAASEGHALLVRAGKIKA